MPDIHAAAGDPIEVTITTTATPTTMTARMMAKGNDGKWEVELAGDPPMRGKVNIDGYEWSHEGRCWRKKVVGEAPPSLLRPPYETFKEPTCKGSYALGTDCGWCEKCTWERAQTVTCPDQQLTANR